MKKSYIILLIISILGTTTHAQNALKLGTSAPYHISTGFEYLLLRNTTLQGKIGVIPKFYSDIFTEHAQQNEISTNELFIMQSTEGVNWMFELGANLHFGKYYAGLFGQQMMMTYSTPTNILLPTFFTREDFLQQMEDRIGEAYTENTTVNSQSWNVGLVFGRRIEFNMDFGMVVEISVAKCVGSNSTIYHSDETAEVYLTNKAADGINSGMKDLYSGYLMPALNVYFTYNFLPEPDFRRRRGGGSPLW